MPKKIYHIKSFDGGINKKADPRDISDKELVEVTNASVSNIGRITMPGDGKSAFATVNEEDVLVSPTANQELGTMINNTPISPGYGLFSFSHDYNFDNTTSNTEPEQINTEYMCINDGAHIDVWTDTRTTAHTHWKQSLIKLGHVHDTGYDGTSENLINLNTVKSIYYKADNGVRICDANFGEEQIQALTNGAITSDATTQFNVDSGHGLKKNEYIKIDAEIMKVTTAGSTQIAVERGRFGTKIANHVDDSSITRLNVPKILCHIKRPMLDKAGANVTINRWIQDVQMPEPPKYDALTVFDASIIGYDGTNLTTQGIYPSEPEKVNLGISLNSGGENARLAFKDGITVTSDTTSTETVVTITLAAETDDGTSTEAVDLTSSTYNFAVGKFISIEGATGEGTALNGVFEIVGFGDNTGEVKIAADTDVVGYVQTGEEIVILEDEIMDDNLKNKYILGMSYMYDGGGSALQESDITTGLFNSGPNLIFPDNTFRTKGTAIPMFRTIRGTGDDMHNIGNNLISNDTANNSTFTSNAGNWVAHGSSVSVSHSSQKLVVACTGTTSAEQGCKLPAVSISGSEDGTITQRVAYKISADIDMTTPSSGTQSIFFKLGGTATSALSISTTESTITGTVIASAVNEDLIIYTATATDITFTVDNVKIEPAVANLDENNTHDIDWVSPGLVTSSSFRNWIYYETQPETPIEVETEYHVSGSVYVNNANSGTEEIRVYVGVGPGAFDVSDTGTGSQAAVPVTRTFSADFSGLVEFAGIAKTASSGAVDATVPVAIQIRNFSSGTNSEHIKLHSINVTKANFQPMSQSNAIDLRSVKNISKSYIAFLCNNSKVGGAYEDSTVPVNTWNERIEGFRIYMKQVDIIGGGLADEWTMLYDVDLKDGTYVMHAKDSDEETLRLGDISSNTWNATSTNDNHALVTGNVTGDSIKVPPTLTYESQTGYKAGTNLFARYKASAIVDRKVYIGNLKIGDKTFPDRMIKADTDKFDSFPDDGTHFIDVATSDGESIIALESSGDKLIQFKEKTAYAIRVTSAGEELVDTWSGAGVKHSCQIAKTSDGVFWVNAQGIYYYNGEQLSNVSKDKFNIDNWLTNEDFKNPVIVGYDKYSNKIIILTPNISNAQSSGYIYDINNQAVTQHNNLFNWYALFNTSDEVFGNTESEL